MVTNFYDFLDPLSAAPTIVAAVCGPSSLRKSTRFNSAKHALVDPGIRYPFADEYMAGVESAVGWGISAKAQIVRREFKHSIGFIDRGSEWQPVERRDPGPMGEQERQTTVLL